MELLFATDFLRVHLHFEALVLEMEWLDFASGPAFREAIEQAQQLARQHGVRCWLPNNTQMRAIRVSDQQWLEAQPLWLELTCVALVESTDAMNRMAITSLLDRHRTAQPLVRQFATLADAHKWLLIKPT
jgi:hypothetical protein